MGEKQLRSASHACMYPRGLRPDEGGSPRPGMIEAREAVPEGGNEVGAVDEQVQARTSRRGHVP